MDDRPKGLELIHLALLDFRLNRGLPHHGLGRPLVADRLFISATFRLSLRAVFRRRIEGVS